MIFPLENWRFTLCTEHPYFFQKWIQVIVKYWELIAVGVPPAIKDRQQVQLKVLLPTCSAVNYSHQIPTGIRELTQDLLSNGVH